MPDHAGMSTGQAASGIDRLTRREREILELVADAQTNDAIAARLGITRRAVERHVNSIFRKLEIRDEGGVNRRVRAALLYRGV
jgi:DNA-binding NarL/FixJ family response regulator